jgi:hypothetical protein
MSKKITIDGREFELDSLSEDIKRLIVRLRLADQRMAQLQQDLGFVQTARTAYARELVDSLPEA